MFNKFPFNTRVFNAVLAWVNNLTAKARIQINFTKTLTSKARIQATLTKTTTALGRMKVTITKTSIALGRIKINFSKTTTALGRIFYGYGLHVYLRPVSDGDLNEWSVNSGSNPHYTYVDEEVPDGNTTYVYNPPDLTIRKEFYHIQDVPADIKTKTIISLTINAWTNANFLGALYLLLKNSEDEADYVTTLHDPEEDVWYLAQVTTTINPFTGQPWTWNDLDGIQIGILSISEENNLKVTSVFADIAVIGNEKKIAALARMLVNLTKTLTARARILINFTKTLTASGRIQISFSKTSTSKARLKCSFSKTCGAKARIYTYWQPPTTADLLFRHYSYAQLKFRNYSQPTLTFRGG